MEQGSWDRELYPALIVTLMAGFSVFLIWRFCLNAPAFPACWFFTHWHIYCPACGGTRAMIALAHGQVIQACYWNPAVPVGVVSVAAYLLSQTIWRLRGWRGWVLRYSNRWLRAFLLLMAVNCLLRNLLWFGLEIAL